MYRKFKCSAGTPLVNEMLRKHAEACGFKLDSNITSPSLDDKFPHMLVKVKLAGTVIITQCTPDNEGGLLSIEQFMDKLTELGKPKPSPLAGHPVVFGPNHITVGCTSIPLCEVDTFIKEYQNHYNK